MDLENIINHINRYTFWDDLVWTATTEDMQRLSCVESSGLWFKLTPCGDLNEKIKRYLIEKKIRGSKRYSVNLNDIDFPPIDPIAHRSSNNRCYQSQYEVVFGAISHNPPSRIDLNITLGENDE